MQVNSVSLSSNARNTAFSATIQEQLFASLKDRDLKQIAFAKASKDVDDKKHRAIDNALFMALPLAGGLSTLARTYSPEIVKAINPRNLRTVRALQFAKSTAGWGAGLAALGALWNAKDYLAKKFDIIKNNPVFSFAATFAAGFGVLAAVDRFGAKGISNVLNHIDDKTIISGFVKTRRFLNNNKVLNKTSEFAAKFPSPIKDIARGTAALAPLLVIGTQIGHIFGHQSVKSRVAQRNYEELKLAQENIKEDIADERINIKKKTIADLHAEYEQMLNSKPIMDARTNEPITFEQFVILATTYVK